MFSRERIKALEDELKLKQQLNFDKSKYWLDDGQTKDGPFCQRCYDVEKKLVRLQHNLYNDNWHCTECKNVYSDHR